MSDDKIVIEIDNPIWDYEGEEMCEDDDALAYLFAQDCCLMVGGFFEPKEGPNREIATVHVLANDVFMWACADCIELQIGEIKTLYKMVRSDPKWGSVKWCCIQRNMQPQPPMKRDIIKDGSWDEDFEALARNPSDKSLTTV